MRNMEAPNRASMLDDEFTSELFCIYKKAIVSELMDSCLKE